MELLEKVMSFDVMAVVIALNILLGGVYGAIVKLQDMLPGDQTGILKGLNWGLEMLKKIIDVAGMNRSHEKK